jgi:hypothetical protein
VIALREAEIAILRDSVLQLTSPSAVVEPTLEFIGLNEAQRLWIAGPIEPSTDEYLVGLVCRDELSLRGVIFLDDPPKFRRFFEDLARHREGWEGEKKVESREGQFVITCVNDNVRVPYQVEMIVSCALDIPSFDPYWTAQMRLEVAPESLDALAAQAKEVFPDAPQGG